MLGSSSSALVRSPGLNFAARVVERLGPDACFIDAATGESLPSAELSAAIAGFAVAFLETGLVPGDRLLIACGLNPRSALAYFGAMYAGLVPVPVDERVFSSRGESLYTKVCAQAVWVSDGIHCEWVERLGVRRFVGQCSLSVDGFPPYPSAAPDLAVLMPTSGSTAAPRWVMVSHGNLIANTEAIIRSQALGPDERAMLVLPLSYCFGASVVHTHLYRGGSVVFDSRFMFPDKVLRAIATYRCTTFAGVPSVYHLLLGRSSLRTIPLPCLRRFLQAGGGLAPDVIQTMRGIVPQAQFFVMYGQTEATARISCLPPDHLEEKLGSVGMPLDNLEIRIIDEQGQALLPGRIGEILARGPSICGGYWKAPEETARQFQDGWLHTGDLGSVDEDGYLWIHGRKGDFAKIRGVRVGFAEIKAMVMAIPGVCECAVSSEPHPEAGEALVLYLVPAQAAGDLREQVRRALPPQWTCGAIHLVAHLPQTPNGKVALSLLESAV